MVFLNVQCTISHSWHTKRHHSLHICYVRLLFSGHLCWWWWFLRIFSLKIIPSVTRKVFFLLLFILFHPCNHFRSLLHLARHSIQCSFRVVRGVLDLFLLTGKAVSHHQCNFNCRVSINTAFNNYVFNTAERISSYWIFLITNKCLALPHVFPSVQMCTCNFDLTDILDFIERYVNVDYSYRFKIPLGCGG